MPLNVYDQAARYVAKLDAPGFLAWLLGLPPDQFLFRRWIDTRRVPFPGEPDRTNDTVAHVEDVAAGQAPWAVIVEFQAEPDALLFGRLMVYAGLLWLETKPTDLPGDRYHLAAVVVNLTGQGRSGRVSEWPQVGTRTALEPREVNLRDTDAAATLDGVAAGSVGPTVLPLVPLMHGGGDPAIIQRWLALASAEPDARRRGDYGGLAAVFAEAPGCVAEWKQALKGWNMIQSQQVLEWMAEGKAEGLAEGTAKTKRGDILRSLGLRFGSVPADLAGAVNAATDLSQLEQWFDAAVTAASLEDFRRATGL
jgi:hypothetical protein